MEIFFSIMLLLLFAPFLLGLGGANVFMSGLLSPDKIVFIVMLYVVLILLLMRGAKRFQISLAVFGYLVPALFFLLILVYHYLHTGKASVDEFLYAKKELMRLAFFIVLLTVSSGLRMKLKHYLFIVYEFALFGIPLGLMTVYSSLTGTSTRRDMIVGEYVRAGGDLTSTNNLAAVLNVTTLCALSALLLAKKPYQKLFWLLAALISQGGRFFTFSNGSVAGFVISAIVVLILSRKFDRMMYVKVRRGIIIFIAVLTMITIFSGKSTLLLGRLMETDKTGTLVSVSSRLSQYEGLWRLIVNEPEKLLLGVGTANVHSVLKTKQTLHNAYLLPLVTAGIGGFVAFLSLWGLTLRNFYRAVRVSVESREGMIVTIFLLAAYLGYSFQILTVPYTLSVSTLFFFLLGFAFVNYVKGKRAGFSEA